MIGKGKDDDATFVFINSKQVYSHNPEYGGNLDKLVEILTGVKPEVLWLKQCGKPYPDNLEEFRQWPLHPLNG